MEDWEEQLDKINKSLDRIEIELNMNLEAAESLEIEARLFKAELDYLAEKDLGL